MKSLSPMSTAAGLDAPTRFSQLPVSVQAIVRLCQTVNFGGIHRLRIENGQPILDPPPEVFFDLKLDRDETARSEVALADFELCGEIRRLLRHVQQLESGVIERIEIQAGIPRRILVSGRVKGRSASAASAGEENGHEC
jgi:hypothetical protein